jgi:hypothetical protein
MLQPVMSVTHRRDAADECGAWRRQSTARSAGMAGQEGREGVALSAGIGMAWHSMTGKGTEHGMSLYRKLNGS